MCERPEVVLVGGGNSAGQAAVFLVAACGQGADAGARRRACREHVALPDRPHRRHAQHRAAPATELVGLPAIRRQARAVCAGATRATGAERQRPIRNVFLFIGADPETDWLQDCGVTLDAQASC